MSSRLEFCHSLPDEGIEQQHCLYLEGSFITKIKIKIKQKAHRKES